MTTATLVPLAEYLQTSYSPDCEWVDGELLERNLGDFGHSSVQRLILKFFLLNEEETGLSAYPELRLQVNTSNFRVPDVLVLPLGMTYQDVVLDPPLLCVEVLSPDDRMSEVQEKITDYLRMGVPAIWVIDPRKRTALSIDKSGQHPVHILALASHDVSLEVADIFRQMDKLAAKSS